MNANVLDITKIKAEIAAFGSMFSEKSIMDAVDYSISQGIDLQKLIYLSFIFNIPIHKTVARYREFLKVYQDLSLDNLSPDEQVGGKKNAPAKRVTKKKTVAK